MTLTIFPLKLKLNSKIKLMQGMKTTTAYQSRINNLTLFCPEDAFIIYTPAERSRSESPYLQKPAKASNRHLSFFFFRCVEAWNALRGVLKSSPSLPAFKRGLKQIDLSRFLKRSAI
jgi:hypothetical protein